MILEILEIFHQFISVYFQYQSQLVDTDIITRQDQSQLVDTDIITRQDQSQLVDTDIITRQDQRKTMSNY